MNPSKIAINNPASVYILILMIFVIGILSYQNMPREASPDIQIPMLIVTVPFPGASPEDVESLITNKVETEFQNLEYLKEIKSTSSEGATSITLEFTADFDVDDARIKVREALDDVKPDLPDDAEEPIITEINLSEQPLLYVNLVGNAGLSKLKDIAEDLKDDIEGIQGILEVRRTGGLEREVRIYVNPEKLRNYKLDINQVSNAISNENTNLPGGTITIGPTKYLIRVPAEFEHPREINDAVLTTHNNVPVLVKDVAQVVYGFKEVTSRSRLNGVESVSLAVVKRSGENLLSIRQSIFDLVDKYEEQYQGRVGFSISNDAGKWVIRFNQDLENNIATGFILVLVVLLLVMGFRNALFVAAAIPLSFLISIFVLDRMGLTLNMMVLFSLILALGMMVDNAVVVVENIYRHMQAGKPRLEAAKVGIQEVAVPIVTSTLTTLCAFAPLLYMPDIVGEFMSFIPKTLIVALSASLVVGLVINPVLCSTLMKAKSKQVHSEDELELLQQSRALRIYQAVLSFHLRNRGLTLIITVACFIGIMATWASVTLPNRGVEFFPPTEPSDAFINLRAPNGSTLEVSDRYVREVENILSPYDSSLDNRIANVGMRAGFGGADESGASSYLSHVVLAFPDWEHWDMRPSKVIEEVRKKLNDLTGVEIDISEAQAGPPTGPPVNIEIAGDDFKVMDSIADQIKARIKDHPNLVNLTDDFDQGRPEIQIIIDREKSARLGLRAMDIAMTVRTAINGREVSKFRDGLDEYDIIVQLDESFRSSERDLESLFVVTPTGQTVPMSELATIVSGPSYGSIRHVDSERVLTISGDAEGLPGPELLKQIQARLEGLTLPKGYSIRYTGENKDLQKSQAFLMQSFLMAIFLIFLVLVTQFNSVMVPFIILSSVLLSLMGVFLGLIIQDLPFSVLMGGMGTVSLAGIVVNNAIVMIDFIRQLRERGLPRDEAVLMAALVRLRPVMLTAITTVLGLMPVAIGMDINFYRGWNFAVFGSESGTFWKPMAYAIIYGLSVATILTLVVVPVLYSALDGMKQSIAGLLNRSTKRSSGRSIWRKSRVRT